MRSQSGRDEATCAVYKYTFPSVVTLNRFCRIHQIQTRWKILLSRISRFNVQSSRKFMQFDVNSPERKTKADWNTEVASTAEKRQKIGSNIQNVSKITLQQHRIPSPEVSVTKTKVSPVQSTFEVALSANTSESNQKPDHVSMILIAVKEKLVSWRNSLRCNDIPSYTSLIQ